MTFEETIIEYTNNLSNSKNFKFSEGFNPTHNLHITGAIL